MRTHVVEHVLPIKISFYTLSLHRAIVTRAPSAVHCGTRSPGSSDVGYVQLATYRLTPMRHTYGPAIRLRLLFFELIVSVHVDGDFSLEAACTLADKRSIVPIILLVLCFARLSGLPACFCCRSVSR